MSAQKAKTPKPKSRHAMWIKVSVPSDMVGVAHVRVVDELGISHLLEILETRLD